MDTTEARADPEKDSRQWRRLRQPYRCIQAIAIKGTLEDRFNVCAHTRR